MRITAAIGALAILLLIMHNAYAYLNATYLNTTVILNTSTSARVVETVGIYVSNSSIDQYMQDRGAINLSLAGWQKALGGTPLLVQHIFKSHISNYSLLPGPLVDTNLYGGKAYLTMSYIAYNITSVRNIAPRRFEYTFDESALNFNHAASGQVLPSNARLNVVIPRGADVVSIYPVPDAPQPNFVGNYTNVTTFSWYAGEPLSSFTFSYIVTQDLKDEVLSYFNNIYSSYAVLIYAGIVALVAVIIAYIYVKVFR